MPDLPDGDNGASLPVSDTDCCPFRAFNVERDRDRERWFAQWKLPQWSCLYFDKLAEYCRKRKTTVDFAPQVFFQGVDGQRGGDSGWKCVIFLNDSIDLSHQVCGAGSSMEEAIEHAAFVMICTLLYRCRHPPKGDAKFQEEVKKIRKERLKFFRVFMDNLENADRFFAEGRTRLSSSG